jgi:phospholipid/cholesterol/gamma-HCH transport system permease protein
MADIAESGAPPSTATLVVTDAADGRRILAVSGQLDATTLPKIWGAARRAVAEVPAKPIVIDAAGVDYCDGAGVALFIDLLRHPREGKIEVANLRPAFQTLLKQFDPRVLEHDLDPPPPRGPRSRKSDAKPQKSGATSAAR